MPKARRVAKKNALVSVGYIANTLIFLLTIVVMSLQIFKNREDVYKSLFHILDNNDYQINIVMSTIIVLFFVPSFLYMIKLNFSLTAFETNNENFNKYLQKLTPKFKMLEGSVRFLVYLLLLIFLAKLNKPLTNLVESIFPLKIVEYGNLPDRNPYYESYKGFPFLTDILIFNMTFFFILLVWDAVLYFSNLLCNHKLSKTEFFKDFVFQHLLGFFTWVILVVLLLTTPGHRWLSNSYIYIMLIMAAVITIYIRSVYQSLRDVYNDFQTALYIEHKT